MDILSDLSQTQEMRYLPTATFFFLVAANQVALADPPKPPQVAPPGFGGWDAPQTPTGGGDHVPVIDTDPSYVHCDVGLPRIDIAKLEGVRIHFKFTGTRSAMRFNIIWSRLGKSQTDIRWGVPALVPTRKSLNDDLPEEYIINEYPVWDTDYTFKVQEESFPAGEYFDRECKKAFSGWTTMVFHTPHNPAFSTTVRDSPSRPATPSKQSPPNPFNKADVARPK